MPARGSSGEQRVSVGPDVLPDRRAESNASTLRNSSGVNWYFFQQKTGGGWDPQITRITQIQKGGRSDCTSHRPAAFKVDPTFDRLRSDPASPISRAASACHSNPGARPSAGRSHQLKKLKRRGAPPDETRPDSGDTYRTSRFSVPGNQKFSLRPN